VTTLKDSSTEQYYRLHVTTLAVYWREGKGQHLHIPAGAILSKSSVPEACSPFVKVLWNFQSLQIFAEDFENRTQPVAS